ncbi:hypothetical protein Emag_004156 [Eimeria magna]
MSEFLTFFRSEVVGPPEGEAANSQSQVEALRRVDWLSSALGPKQTRLLLVPLLAQVQREVLDKDELLSLFAVQWRTVARVAAADTTANEADHQAALSLCAEALAQLADMEEKCIRNEAVESLLYLPSLLPPTSRCSFVRQRLFPLCSSLATSESSLFARCAAARLFPHLVKYAEADRASFSGGSRGASGEALTEKRLPAQEPEHLGSAGAPPRAGGSTASLVAEMGGDAAAAQSFSLKRIIQLYESLCADESFLVRREAIQELPNLIRGARAAEGVEVSDELALIALRILREAFGETSDFLRAAATGAVVRLATAFPSPKRRLLDIAMPRQQVVASPQNGGSETSMPVEGESEKKGIFSVGEALSLHLLGAADPSWRVRSVAAKEMIAAIKFAPLNFSDFHPSLCLLLKDFALRDVRLEAVRCVAQAARVLPGEEVTVHLAPLVKQLLSDFVPPSKPADPWVDVGTTAAFPGGQNAAFAAAVDAALAVAQNAEPTAAKAIVKELINTLHEGDLFAAMCIAKRVPEFCSLCQSRSSAGGSSVTPKNVDQEAASLIQALCELRQQAGLTADWRLRLELVKQMPAIANALGGSFFRTWLSTIYLEALSDPICEVREAAVGACKARAARPYIACILHREKAVFILA